MFSPWYAWAGRRRPLNHCCVNLLLSGPGGRWTMTERGEGALSRSDARLRIGPSDLSWDGETLTARLDERAFPHLHRIRGVIRIRPEALTGAEFPLDAAGRHLWRPHAPRARIEVDLDRPGWRWRGEGYFDANSGARPPEEDFRRWEWSCYRGAETSVCFYDVERLDGGASSLSLRFDGEGGCEPAPPPPPADLRPGFWRVARRTRADAGSRPEIRRTLLDAPFYVRSLVSARVNGDAVSGMHESLDLRRLRSPVVKAMLATRIPRRPG